MTIKQLIEMIQCQPEDALVELGVNGNIQPCTHGVYWEKDRNGLETLMLGHPATDDLCHQVYKDHIR